MKCALFCIGLSLAAQALGAHLRTSDTNRTGTFLKLGDEGFSFAVKGHSTDGCILPKNGDSLTMHYIGMLSKDGTTFDSSRARGEPFKFVLGRTRLIRGWTQGMPSVCLGERGILHIPSFKGYGSNGAPPAIPANAALDFDVELLAINDMNAPQYHPAKPMPKKPSADKRSWFAKLMPSWSLLALDASFLQVQSGLHQGRFTDNGQAIFSAPKKVDLNAKMPLKAQEQGFSGKKVQHVDKKTATGDWRSEYGPKVAPKKSGSVQRSVASVVVLVLLNFLL